MDEIDIEIYVTTSGKRPFELWFEKIKNAQERTVIFSRINRIRLGNFGDHKALQDGVYELRIHCGAGVRIYYGKIGKKVILLLCGGDKKSQDKDITKAKEYLKDYLSRRY